MSKIVYPVKRWQFKSADWNGYWVDADTKAEAMKDAKKVLKAHNDGDRVFELRRDASDELEEEMRIGRWSHGVYADRSTW
jgi:hypothetical protein